MPRSAICHEKTLEFVVTRNDVGGTVAVAEWPGKADFVYLYDCARLRQGERR